MSFPRPGGRAQGRARAGHGGRGMRPFPSLRPVPRSLRGEATTAIAMFDCRLESSGAAGADSSARGALVGWRARRRRPITAGGPSRGSRGCAQGSAGALPANITRRSSEAARANSRTRKMDGAAVATFGREEDPDPIAVPRRCGHGPMGGRGARPSDAPRRRRAAAPLQSI